MILLCWNCRGLGQTRAVQSLCSLFKTTRPSLVFLSETKSVQRSMNNIRLEAGFAGGLFVDREGLGGGLALMWDDKLEVDVQSYSIWHVDAVIKMTDGRSWRFTGFYGDSNDTQRRHSWTLLRRLKTMNNLPWLCGGDFNETLFSHEKKGGLPSNGAHMRAFQDCLNDCQLRDLGFSGYPYTWSNKQDDNMIEKRLDRMVANTNWIDLFPHSSVKHVFASHSDHLPILTQLDSTVDQQPRRTFVPRYDPFWLRDEECLDIINNYWCPPSSLQALNNNVVELRDSLKHWSSVKHGNMPRKIERLRKKINRRMEAPDFSAQEISRLQSELAYFESLQEEYWRQRSRAEWLHLGDRNNSYFHHKASARKDRNEISKLKDSTGDIISDISQIQSLVRDHFMDLFTADPALTPLPHHATFHTLTAENIVLLEQPYTAEEISIAVKQMPGTKAPGPDGMQAIFLHRCWKIIGSDIIRLALSFLNGDASIEPLNHTYICLVPKKKSPEIVSDFRPIGLCNTLYKLISKVLANRLKKVLGDVIDEAQSAFVPGRFITDNAVIAIESFHTMQDRRSRNKSYLALKLDLSKAFDRVDWGYLRLIMERMRFPRRYIHLIMSCITTVSLSVLVNGSPTLPFKPTRGIRQGDPISPFLFLICAEGLSSLIRGEALAGRWNGISFGGASPQITHLLFADDSLLFLEANQQNALAAKKLLDDYCSMSGQRVNLEKSNAYFSKNLENGQALEVCEALGVTMGSERGRYLGLPFLIGRTRREIFQYIEDRVRKKVSGWKEKFLSPAGKEILIKSVLQAIPNYVMQCFVLPVSICDKITSITRQFWWTSSGKDKSIAWASWDKICLPKGAGGIGFRDIKGFNLAMIAKQGWRFVQSPGTLVARVLKAKYHQNSTFMEAPRGSRSSYLWRSILQGRDVLKLGLRKRVDRGLTTRIWKDPWLPKPYSFTPFPTHHNSFPNGRVCELIDQASGNWKEDVIREIFLPFDAEAILSIPIGLGDTGDSFIWHHMNHGGYTVRSGYHTYMEAQRNLVSTGQPASDANNRRFWTRLWSITSLPKVRVFLWRALKGILPTHKNLQRRVPNIEANCKLCNSLHEDDFHVLFGCAIAREVWEQTFPIIEGWPVRTVDSVLHWALTSLDREGLCYFSLLCWFLWKGRCSKVFEGKTHTALQVITQAGGLAAEILSLHESHSSHPSQAIRHTSTWHPPAPNSLSVNVDASFGEDGMRACGAIVRDHLGCVIQATSTLLPTGVNVLHGELLAILHGLELAHVHGYTKVEIWSDSLTAIRLLESNEDHLHPLAALVHKCLARQSEFPSCLFYFTRRENNYPAHLLARWSVLHSTPMSWGPNPPPYVLDAALADLL